MGSKSAAKQIMEAAGVPLIPGYHGDDQDPATLRAAADSIGYPVLLKATAGGGGKGMRAVAGGADFDAALAAARREAAASFGDERMLVEKYLARPRHVEVQVFCDGHGNAVYLAERDCSIQRRHQKVLEEAPAPGVDEALRKRMGAAAVDAARAIDYRGAGTVEFLLDDDGEFYFMEMNTRLQVEHPVTEMITRQDLVEWQLRVAAGEPLPLAQDDIRIRGHAIEARVYAEDAQQDFIPATGRLSYLAPPAESRHVRVDTGVRAGDEITQYYDPMIAKLVVWDEDRPRALDRLAGALRDYRAAGTVTNLDFLYNVATTSAFRAAELDTGFIERQREAIFRPRPADVARDVAHCAVALLLERGRSATPDAGDPHNPWCAGDGWRMNQPHLQQLLLHCHGEDHAVTVERQQAGLLMQTGTASFQVVARLNGELLDIAVDGYRVQAVLARAQPGWTLFLPDHACHFHAVAPDTGEDGGPGGNAALDAPMNGTVISLLVEPGSEVEAGAPLLILEAMKMEHTIRAPTAGTVERFLCAAGDLVDGGASLVDFTAQED
jgi:3-methylcrotonyl-CoA carboxylase alpha subunit